MHNSELWLYFGSGFVFAWSLASLLFGAKQMKNAGESYKATSQLHQITNAIIHKTGADRALLIKIENGGKTKYATVLIESHNGSTRSVIGMFQMRKLDKSYFRIIEELLENGQVEKITEDMKHPSLLRRVYAANKITCSIMFLLHEEKNKGPFHFWIYSVRRILGNVYLFKRIYFLSVETTDENLSIMGDEQYSFIEGMANNAKNVLKEASDKKII